MIFSTIQPQSVLRDIMQVRVSYDLLHTIEQELLMMNNLLVLQLIIYDLY